MSLFVDGISSKSGDTYCTKERATIRYPKGEKARQVEGILICTNFRFQSDEREKKIMMKFLQKNLLVMLIFMLMMPLV